jgi:hypothetical protein
MKKLKKIGATLALALGGASAFAQNGVTGINSATTSLKTYVAPVTNVTLVIGGIVGIVGAIRVYSKWNSGDQDINKELMGWGGSCVFLGCKGPSFTGASKANIFIGAWGPYWPVWSSVHSPWHWSICGWASSF